MLIVLGLVKLFATSLLLATGWKGGYIFPIMFAGIALGLALDLLFPGIPVAVCVAATMAGALVAALRAPLFAALFTLVLVQKETAAVIAVAVVVSALLTALVGAASLPGVQPPRRNLLRREPMNNLFRPLVIYLVGVAAIFVILFGIRGSASIINPILLAAVITITVLPIPSRLTKRGMPGWLALVLSILLVVLLLGLVIATVFFSITKLTTELPTYMASASQQANEDLATTEDLRRDIQIEQVTTSMGPVAQGCAGECIGHAGSIRIGTGDLLFHDQRRPGVAHSLPPGPGPGFIDHRRVIALTEDVRKYMTVLTGINFLVGLGDTVFLWFLGVDYALLWGLLAWFMGYIPSIGFIIALIPPVLMAYAQYGLQTALIVLVGYILINGGVQNFIQPKLMGQRLEDLAGGRVRRLVHLGIPAGWDWRHPGSAA